MRNHFLRAGDKSAIGPLSITASLGDQTDTSSYTYSNVSIGTEEDADRYIVICASAAHFGSVFSISGITVNGFSATICISNSANGTSSIANAIAIYPLASGTTANIGITTDNTAAYSSIHVGYFISRGQIPQIVDSYSVFSISGSSITVGDTTTTKRGGLLVVNAASGNEVWNAWTGITELATRDMNSNDNHEVCANQTTANALTWSGGHSASYDLLTVTACSLH